MTKISAASAITTLADTDELAVASSGASKKITAANLRASIVKAGTSFPGSPATNERYFRTDLSLEFFYDGTRWLTTTQYTLPFPVQIAAAGTNTSQQMATYYDLDMYIEKFIIAAYVATTNDGTRYWSFQPAKSSTAAAATNLGTALNTSADAANTRLRKSIAVNAALGGSATYPVLFITATKTSTPGNCDFNCSVVYRLIGT